MIKFKKTLKRRKELGFWTMVKSSCENEKYGCIGFYCKQEASFIKNTSKFRVCHIKYGSELCKIFKSYSRNDEALAYAKKQIKIHEGKTKKPSVKTDVRDMANVVKDETVKESLKVETKESIVGKEARCLRGVADIKAGNIYIVKAESSDFLSLKGHSFSYPKYRFELVNYHHTVDPNEKKVESVTTTTPSDGMTIKPDPTPLDIAKMIRDNGYRCSYNMTIKCLREKCPIYEGSGCGSMSDYASEYSKKIRIRLIDTYISDHDKVEPIMPTPFTIEELGACMKIDMWVYYFNDKVARINLKNIHTISASKSEISLISTAEISNATDYYKTLADAVKVAESKWGVK